MPTQIKETCPHCGQTIERYRTPSLTVDIIIRVANSPAGSGIILIKRKNEPMGWAIPGGFVDYGETVESAAVREAREETSLDVSLKSLLGVYSDPKRDPRGHTVSVVFVAEGRGRPEARDDAADLGIFTQDHLPGDLAFDHREILKHYFETST